MTAEYATAPPRGKDRPQTVHILHDHFAARTLCGVHLNDRWLLGDETVSGIAATCARCRKYFGVSHEG